MGNGWEWDGCSCHAAGTGINREHGVAHCPNVLAARGVGGMGVVAVRAAVVKAAAGMAAETVVEGMAVVAKVAEEMVAEGMVVVGVMAAVVEEKAEEATVVAAMGAE